MTFNIEGRLGKKSNDIEENYEELLHMLKQWHSLYYLN